ncbi:heat shock factor protein 5 isoform X3 [Ascaphus truei]|uniref:heat shock factor protein 5 isoform X3 n=1 Tax=Ascaphus truei TaxID=8439 RepID=UPI003F5991AD
MDVEEALLSTPINPNNFPAKLWRLVNSPRYQSIRWDLRGEGVIIDQQLFESELLCPSNPLDETNELFKTTNFTSFIRQLNLYGFRKVVMGVGGNPGLLHPGGDLGAGDGHLHHFHNIHFHKEHPDLLVNLKRLTSANKAKMAAGLEVNSRPPNRFQRLLSNSLVEQSPMTIGQLHRSFRRENLSPYPYVSATSHNHVAFPLKGLDRTPVPTRTWSNTLGLLPSQVESPSSFPDKGILFPVLQRLPTEVTYTLQPSPSSVHMQQGHAAMTGAAHKYSSYAPTAAQYPQAYYPTALLGLLPALLQCCSPPSHMEHLTGCSNPAASYQHCSYFQNPPMQSSYPMDYLHPNWPSNDSESKKGADQSIACSLSQASEYIYPIHSSQNEARLSSAADNMLDPKVSVKLDKELNQPSSELAMVLMEQGLSSSPLKVNMKNPRGASESTLPMEPMQFLVSDIVSDNKLGKDEIMARSRERRGTTKQGKSPDLHLLVDVACKQEQFPKEEELGE